jgi:RsiW-degrading membrane proteinase PrsW (M82 family)
MKIGKTRLLLTVAIAAIVACVLQLIGLIRYIVRLPEDWVGIVLYIATIIAFALIAVGFYIQWRQQKLKE